jgi:hypothetical protein
LLRLGALDSSKKVNHEMPPERFCRHGRRENAHICLCGMRQQEMPASWGQKAESQKLL